MTTRKDSRNELDILLDRVEAPAPGAALMGRIMAEAEAAPQGAVPWIKSVWAQGIGLLVAGGMGLMVGLVQAAEIRSDEDLFVPQEIEQFSALESWFGEGSE